MDYSSLGFYTPDSFIYDLRSFLGVNKFYLAKENVFYNYKNEFRLIPFPYY